MEDNLVKKIYNEILDKSYNWILPERIEKIMKHPEIEDWIKSLIDRSNSGILDDLINGKNPMWNAVALDNLLNGYSFEDIVYKGKSLDAHGDLSVLAEEAKAYARLCSYFNFYERNFDLSKELKLKTMIRR